MGNFFLRQKSREHFRLFDGDRSDQHRLTAFAAIFNCFHDRRIFLFRCPVNLIVGINTGNRNIGGHLDDFKAVDFEKFVCLCGGRAGHAGKFFIEPEIILEGDGGECLVLRLDRYLFLGFQRLMQSFRIAASLHHAAGELVDDDDLVVLHDVVIVQLEHQVGAQAFVHVVDDLRVLDIVEIVGFEQARRDKALFDLFRAFLGQGDGAALLVGVVEAHAFAGAVGDRVVIGDEVLNHLVDRHVEIGLVLGRAGDDQRGARFVDQDRVDFVDDRMVERALHHLAALVLHVVAQVVEAEFVVGTVGNIGLVGCPLFLRWLARGHDTHLHAQEPIELAHPVGITTGQVIVHGNHVDTLAGQRVEVHGSGSNQRLALTGLHFRDPAFVQGDTTDQLDVVMTHTHNPAARFTHGCEGFRKKRIQGFAFVDPTTELRGLALQLGVGQIAILLFKLVNAHDRLAHSLDFSGVFTAEHLGCKLCEHRPLLL